MKIYEFSEEERRIYESMQVPMVLYQFIDEKIHTILDLYMVEQVCKEVVPRQEIGLPIIPVSVNFSAQDFDYVDMVDEINKILEKYNVGN